MIVKYSVATNERPDFTFSEMPSTVSSSESPVPPNHCVELWGRKPVIYLYPPSRLSHVTVQLSLVSSWSFSAVYPPPQTTINPEEYQSVQSLIWSVAAEADGTLIDKTTGTEVSYLYWEAK
jgi:hypothetical protein